MFFSNHWNVKSGATAPFEPKLKCAPNSRIFCSFTGIFHRHHGPVIFSIAEQDPLSNEESLIDRDSDVFDTEITISTIFVSRANLSDNVGKHIPFLEAIRSLHSPLCHRGRIPFPRIHRLVCREILTGREGHIK
jgi:hypothetical protein